VFVRGLKFLALLVFVGVASWAWWLARNHDIPGGEKSEPLPKDVPVIPGRADPTQPDLRF
jgi:hypothetical protein